jgi:hypothetical protein
MNALISATAIVAGKTNIIAADNKDTANAELRLVILNDCIIPRHIMLTQLYGISAYRINENKL